MKSKDELPQGLIMALSQNVDAMQTFSNLPKEIRQSVINSASTVTSKEGMESLVSRLVSTPPTT
jgi:hypothetical protein